MIKAVIFDLGNVTIKFDETPTFKIWADSSGKSFSEIKKFYQNSSTRKSFERGEITPKQFYDKYVEELGLKINYDDFEKSYCNIFSRNKEVEEIIKSLKGKVKLVLLSNTNEWQYEFCKKKFMILDLFEKRILSYEVGCRKPNPLIFLEALKKAGTLPFNCAYFDDIPEFVYIARLMGIRAFQYENAEKLKINLNEVEVKV